jgi:hypothetical protein
VIAAAALAAATSGAGASPTTLFTFTSILDVPSCGQGCAAGAITGIAAGRESFAVNRQGTVAYAAQRSGAGASIYASNGVDTKLVIDSSASVTVQPSVGINNRGSVGYLTFTNGVADPFNAYYRYDGLTTFLDPALPPHLLPPPSAHVGGVGSIAGTFVPVSAHITNANGMVVQTERRIAETGEVIKALTLSDGRSATSLLTSRDVEFGFGLPNASQVNDNAHLAYYTGSLTRASQLRRQTAGIGGTVSDVIASFNASPPPGVEMVLPGVAPAELSNRGAVAFTSTSPGIRPDGTSGFTTLVNVYMDGRGFVSYSLDGGSLAAGGSFGQGTPLSLNDFNQVAFVGTPYTAPGREGGQGLYVAGLLDQPLRLIGLGDAFMGSTVSTLRIAADSISSTGHVAFLAGLADGRSVLARADPLAGVTPGNPLLPPIVDGGTFRISVYCGDASWGCATRRYIDPIFAEGYEFSLTDGAPAFETVLVPAALPGGDHRFLIEFGGYALELLAGEVFDFTDYITTGVTSFRIRGIDPGEMLDPMDPTAFVTGVTFVPNGNVAFEVLMTALTNGSPPVGVPEPGSLPLLLAAGVGLCAVRYTRRRPDGASGSMAL